MKEFVSVNGINMIEGKHLNWEKAPVYYDKDEPWHYLINVGNIGEMYQFIWNQDTKIISISKIDYSSDWVLTFACDNVEFAEFIVTAFALAQNFEMGKIYEKK